MFIQPEPCEAYRRIPPLASSDSSSPRMRSRDSSYRIIGNTDGGCHVEIAMDGVLVLICIGTEPSDATKFLFYQPEALVIHVVSPPLVARLANLRCEVGSNEIALAARCIKQDDVIERLVRALVVVEHVEQGQGDDYAEALSRAIVTRLLDIAGTPVLPSTVRTIIALPKWRLKRVLDYVDQNIAECITLSGMAKAAGLSRMHFAAQFKTATGLRPHEFVLRRRTEAACELLRSPGHPLVDVALSVGFQTQAHFTTVFKRFVGETPHRWRQANPMQ